MESLAIADREVVIGSQDGALRCFGQVVQTASVGWVLTLRSRLYTLALPVATSFSDDLRRLNAARWRVASGLTIATMVLYFCFIGLVAFNKPLLATLLRPGLSLGMLIGTFVIVSAWVLIWVYVRWANRHYDANVAALRGRL